MIGTTVTSNFQFWASPDFCSQFTGFATTFQNSLQISLKIKSSLIQSATSNCNQSGHSANLTRGGNVGFSHSLIQMSQTPLDKSTIDQVNRLLAQTGERERLKDMLRSKLVECGWTERVQNDCFSNYLFRLKNRFSFFFVNF
jgi:hypothetical protein